MEVLNVVAAALGAFILGAVWYMSLAEPWMDASGVPRDESGNPEGGQSLKQYAMAFALQLVVAGMMRHVFTLSQIDSLAKGVVAGAGIGLFFISPWIALNNLYSGRTTKLTLIDGGYATVACATMGAILTMF